MPTVFTDRKRPYDFVKYELDQRYTRVTGTVKNKTGGSIVAGAIKPGQPLNLNGTQWETVDVGGESGVDGFFVDHRIPEALANDAVTALEYQILVRGPALVNLDAVPVDTDGTTGAFTLATLKTRMEALSPPIIVLREPTTTQEQTT